LIQLVSRSKTLPELFQYCFVASTMVLWGVLDFFVLVEE
jgi:hypothetical protein